MFLSGTVATFTFKKDAKVDQDRVAKVLKEFKVKMKGLDRNDDYIL